MGVPLQAAPPVHAAQYGIEFQLDSLKPLPIHPHEPERMAGKAAFRIASLGLGGEAEPFQTQQLYFLNHFRRDLPLQPNEPAAARQALEQVLAAAAK